MDEALRNGLWNILKIYFWDHVQYVRAGIHTGFYLNNFTNKQMNLLCNSLWLSYFKKPLDHLSNDWKEVLPKLRQYFFECPWHEAYDFIEFIAKHHERRGFYDNFITSPTSFARTLI